MISWSFEDVFLGIMQHKFLQLIQIHLVPGSKPYNH